METADDSKIATPPSISESTLDPFVHEPLNSTDTSIRVLSVYPGEEGSTLQCTVSPHPLQENTYVCLSYMWGPPSPQKLIIANGKALYVRQTLYDFLILTRKLGIAGRLWIDAICIDQTNIPERNSQVQLMAEIYSRAECILIWPGHISPLIGEAISEAFPYTRALLPSRCWEESMNRTQATSHETLHKAIVARHLSAHRAEFDACIALPYWNRAWIFQEIFLAKARWIVVGEALSNWTGFRHVLMKAEAILSRQDRRRNKTPLTNLLDLFEVQVFQYGAEMSFSRQEMHFALSACRARECADIRDRWYACRSVVEEGKDFLVDYGIGKREMLLRIVEHLSDKGNLPDTALGNLKVLADALDEWFLTICLKCARECNDNGLASVPLEYLGARALVKDDEEDSNAEREDSRSDGEEQLDIVENPFLLVAFLHKEVEIWTGKRELFLPDPGRCAICQRVEVVEHGSAHIKTTRIGENQLWCELVPIPEPEDPELDREMRRLGIGQITNISYPVVGRY